MGFWKYSVDGICILYRFVNDKEGNVVVIFLCVAQRDGQILVICCEIGRALAGSAASLRRMYDIV